MIQITDYITLGRSGLKVSPICLGTMTFGNYRWGSQDEEARQIFGAYLEAGGNFIDTADGYARRQKRRTHWHVHQGDERS